MRLAVAWPSRGPLLTMPTLVRAEVQAEEAFPVARSYTIHRRTVPTPFHPREALRTGMRVSANVVAAVL